MIPISFRTTPNSAKDLQVLPLPGPLGLFSALSCPVLYAPAELKVSGLPKFVLLSSASMPLSVSLHHHLWDFSPRTILYDSWPFYSFCDDPVIQQ